MKLASLEEGIAEPFDASQSSIRSDRSLSGLLQKNEAPQMKRDTADVNQAEAHVTTSPPTSDDKQQDEVAKLKEQLRHLEAAHMLGELSMIKFEILRLAEQVEQLPMRIAAEMGRQNSVNNPEEEEAKRPVPGSEKH